MYVCYVILYYIMLCYYYIYQILARFCNKVVTLVHELDCFYLISVYDDVPVISALGCTYLIFI